MTPTQILALVGLWRRQHKDGGDIFAEDVAIEVATTTGGTFGRTRAENCLRHLQEQKLVKKGQWDGSHRLSKTGENLCAALKSMGLREVF
jgi:hypothetical protein